MAECWRCYAPGYFGARTLLASFSLPRQKMDVMRTHRTRSSRRLAKQALELSVAAPLVIAHRVSRMAAAGTRPSARDRNEFALMGTEKILALYQSWGAMWWQACMSQVALAQSISMAAMSAMSGARTGPRLSAATRTAAAKVLSAGLSPFHKKAVANAKRLSRRKASRVTLRGDWR